MKLAINFHHPYKNLSESLKTFFFKIGTRRRRRCSVTSRAVVQVLMRRNSLTIIDVLKPLWMLTYVTGLFPAWCSATERRLLSKIAHRIGIVVNGLLLSVFTIYGWFISSCYQIVTPPADFIFNLFWCLVHLTTIAFDFDILHATRQAGDLL